MLDEEEAVGGVAFAAMLVFAHAGCAVLTQPMNALVAPSAPRPSLLLFLRYSKQTPLLSLRKIFR